MFKLFGRPGWGSVLVEAQLAWYGLDYTVEEIEDPFASTEARARLQAINPVAQIPALLLPDGEVMTESAAITLHLADVAASNSLVPAPGEPQRARFLRWLVFLVANIYPTFTFADDPSRFVPGEEAQTAFRANVDAHAKRLWGIVDAHATAQPWFLEGRFSAIDIYVCTMTRWRPQRDWFAANAPKLHRIALTADELPQLKPVWEVNFPQA